MGKVGRPKKEDSEKAHYKWVTIDIEDYKKLKVHSIKTGNTIKDIVHQALSRI